MERGWWRIRDAIDYMLTTSTATLDFAAKFKNDLLYNRYQSGRDTIRKYAAEPPYAFFVPEGGRDPVAVVELMRRLAFTGVRVHQLERAAVHEGMTHPAGTWVIPMDQEFAEFVRQVLEVQTYPDLREFPDGPLEQPYDAAGWTLPYQMGVHVVAAGAPLGEDFRSAMTLVEGETVDWKEGELARDAAPFDSVPGLGFDTHANAAGILPPAGSITCFWSAPRSENARSLCAWPSVEDNGASSRKCSRRVVCSRRPGAYSESALHGWGFAYWC